MISDVALVPIWEEFRSGGAPLCPECDGRIALSVDGKAYRLCCTDCGEATNWFDAAPRRPPAAKSDR